MSTKRKGPGADDRQAAFDFEPVAANEAVPAEQAQEAVIHIPSTEAPRDFRVMREGLIDWYEVLRGHSLFEGEGEG
jgi:hypothetical protein